MSAGALVVNVLPAKQLPRPVGSMIDRSVATADIARSATPLASTTLSWTELSCGVQKMGTIDSGSASGLLRVSEHG